MDFAKRVLEKYGWSEGQGLGKDSTGITTALKPKVKLNVFGLGHDSAQTFTYRWWEDAFNEAARNVNVETTKDGTKMNIVDEDAVQVSAVKRSKINRDKAKYGSFIKRETLTKGGVTPEMEIDTSSHKLPMVLPAILSDEQLFQACGGRTAHKGARHGLTLSGKLQRVREQEEALLKAFQQNQYKEPKTTVGRELREEGESFEKNKSKKKKKSKTESVCEELAETCVGDETIVKKKKKKKRKSECDECDGVEGIEQSNDGVCETKKFKKSKKKKRHEMAEDIAEISLNRDEDAASETIQKKDKRKFKEEEMNKQDELNTHLEKKPKKKKRKTRETES
ncbi:G patch domain-containing protein 4 [Thrips palmi]|uniref:G patch domain-containing protein 4 n=1 Tax=Thrips palmi TaxID=161013 RepID=A0A6P8Z8Z5_THRPL|nr:G patch domain-containing protein 4 [Thrips palmi]